MTVFVVKEWWSYEGCDWKSLHLTREGAEAAVRLLGSNDQDGSHGFDIEEKEVQP